MAKLPTNTDDPRAYARHTWDEWESLDGYYDFYVNRWRRTLEFIRGQHWNTLKEFDREVLPDWKRFPLINFTLAFYNDYLTDFLKSEIRFSAVPTSPDPEDRDAAEMSEQLLKYLWTKLDYDQKRIDLGAWLISCGTGVLRHYWDTNTGNMVPLGVPTPNGVVPVDPETMQVDPSMQEPEMVDRGEIGVEVVSPQYVRWARNPQDGVMLGLLLSYEEAASMYGEDVAEDLEFSSEHKGILTDLNRIEQPGATPRRDERALVIEHYIPKSSRHPNGLWWTAAEGGQELLTGPWALPAGEIPITSFRWIPVPGERNIGLSPLYDMSFQNKTYEEIMARVIEWYNEVKPKVLLKAGGGIAQGDIDDKPWQEVPVNAGAEPEIMEATDAPQGLFNTLQQIQNDLSLASGKQLESQDERAKGTTAAPFRTPSEERPGESTALAQINSKSSWQEVGETLLHYVAEFYNEPRVMAIQGPDKQFLWREFTGSDIKSDPQNLAATVKVEDLPLKPWNRQSLRDTVVGILNSEAGQLLFAGEDGTIDQEKLNAAMQATGLDVHLDTLDPDVMEARNEEVEFRNLQQGQQPPQVQQWQNHAAHHEQHVQILKSEKFRSWQPHQRQAFLQHVNQTEERLNQEAQQERQSMIEQERALREVREQAELKASVQEEWATQMISLISEATGVRVQDILDLVGQGRGSSEGERMEAAEELEQTAEATQQ